MKFHPPVHRYLVQLRLAQTRPVPHHLQQHRLVHQRLAPRQPDLLLHPLVHRLPRLPRLLV